MRAPPNPKRCRPSRGHRKVWFQSSVSRRQPQPPMLAEGSVRCVGTPRAPDQPAHRPLARRPAGTIARKSVRATVQNRPPQSPRVPRSAPESDPPIGSGSSLSLHGRHEAVNRCCDDQKVQSPRLALWFRWWSPLWAVGLFVERSSAHLVLAAYSGIDVNTRLKR